MSSQPRRPGGPRFPAVVRAATAALLGLLLAAAPARAIEVERVVSPGGITAWLVQDHTNPIISVNFAFRGGAALDPAGREGLAGMVAGLLDEGAGDLKSQAFQKKLADLSISMDFNAGFDNFGGSLKTLTRNRDTAFNLLRLALTKPRFDATPVARIRSQILVELARAAKNPGRIAQRAWWKAAFPNHPYGRSSDGTPQSIKAITVGDLKAFVARRFARSNLMIGVVGDITPDVLKTILDRTFGALPKTPAPSTIADVTPRLTGKITVFRRPFPQSRVVFGQGGIKRNDPDWYAAYVMNYVLGGGGFTSRLMTEVRVKRGLAYSVASWLNPMDHSAVIAGSVGTKNAKVAESIRIIRREWARMRAHGITKTELHDAKTYLTGSFPLSLDSTGSIAAILVAVQNEHLGIDYLSKRNAFIDAVTVADVDRVAKRLLTPKRLTFVVVGQPQGLTGANVREGGGAAAKTGG